MVTMSDTIHVPVDENDREKYYNIANNPPKNKELAEKYKNDLKEAMKTINKDFPNLINDEDERVAKFL